MKCNASSARICAPYFPHSHYSRFVAQSSGTQRAPEFSAQFLLCRLHRCHSCKSVTRSAPCTAIINRELLSPKSGKKQMGCGRVTAFLGCSAVGIAFAIPAESGFLSGNGLTHLQMPSPHAPHPNSLNNCREMSEQKLCIICCI